MFSDAYNCRRQLSGSEGVAYRFCHGSLLTRNPENQSETGKNPICTYANGPQPLVRILS